MALTLTPWRDHASACARVKLHDAALRRAVRPAVAERAHRLQRRDVDDPAPPFRDHRRREPLRQEERRVEIDAHRGVPVGLGDVRHRLPDVDAGGVDDDVGGAEELRRARGAREERLAHREIAGDVRGAAARGPDGVLGGQ